ncbi:MAG: Cytosine/purine/uracil/thiamine/allantoin permease family protein [Verrucomicrobiales bacterium]|nr:Cytosine/purine/uracil/thiamine/allantoin permease family protein [Verrucomicrobiales bacterium]
MNPAASVKPDPLADIRQSNLFNEDLAPVPLERRTWKVGNFAALWISMSACIPTYMLASSLIGGGMNWWQAILTIFLGNLIVLVPMILNAHAGTAYGIPFPVYCRASFGTLGANIPALLRAFVACGWFGIQTWIGGSAIHKILAVFYPSMAGGNLLPVLGITMSQFVCFMFFWSINMAVIYKGIECIRWLLVIKAPLLIALGLLLLGWAYQNAGGFGPMLSQPSAFEPGQAKAGQFWKFFVPGLTGMIGFWATLSLNIPDFSRYAKTQRDQVLGQTLGLPITMALYAFIGVAVTSATTIIYKETLWDPVDVLTRFKNPAVLILAMVALCIATLATNIAANVVSPANDFANLSPKRITFRLGGLITGVVGILMMPWKLLANPESYIFDWLIGYGALLGPIGGILIADYFVVRRRRLNITALYQSEGEYKYTNGFSITAILAFVLGVLPSLPGFLVQVKRIPAASVPAALVGLYGYAWFVGFGIAFAVYLFGRQISPTARPSATI